MKPNSSELLITYQPIEALKDNPRNSRTHSRHQVRQIAASIKTFGFNNPILVDKCNMVIAGHGRLAAAKLLGMIQAPTIRLENLSSDQIRAYMIADNRLAAKAGWDNAILSIELQHLLSIEADFDITITGFEIPEIDLLLSAPTENSDADDAFEIVETPQATSTVGSLWKLGRHRILCGNSVEQPSYTKLLGTKRAAIVFSDPPYNLKIDGHVSGNGATRHREFPMASGEMSEFEFISFLTSALKLLARYSTANSIHFVCIDWRHISELRGLASL